MKKHIVRAAIVGAHLEESGRCSFWVELNEACELGAATERLLVRKAKKVGDGKLEVEL